MPVGVLINVFSVFFGGLIGTLAKSKLTHELKENVTMFFGICALGMGVQSIGQMKNMPAVIFAIIIGVAIGTILHLGELITKAAGLMQRPISMVLKNQKHNMEEQEFLSVLVTTIVLFCVSGTGIYGSIDSGMTGDHSILISKSILDFFTAIIFACNLGAVVSVIAVPQFAIYILLFLAAKMIYPVTTPSMIGDFKACGGFLMLATSLRMLNIKQIPVADVIPAMILIMPVSWIWTTYFMSLF